MIHIVLSCDTNYIMMTKMCIYDIITRKHKDTELSFYILGDKLGDRAKEFDIFNIIDQVHVTVIPQDSETLILRRVDNNFRPDVRLPKTMYLRFLIPTLPEFNYVEQVLYIDPDVLARRDLSELCQTDLHDKGLGMVKDSFFIRDPDYRESLKQYNRWYNAGVILMNLPRLRDINFTDVCVKTANEINLNDQDTINYVFQDEIYQLPPTVQFPIHNLIIKVPRMNDINNWNEFHGTNYHSLEEILDQMVFYHFHEDKTWQMRIPVLKTVWDQSENRVRCFEKIHIVEWMDEETDAKIEHMLRDAALN